MLENDIQVHFIDPIATVLRDPPKDTNWARDLAEKLEGEPVTKELLAACADHLIRQGGKSFPQFKVCLRAIQEAIRGQLRPTVIREHQGYRQGDPITKENFFAACKAHGRLVVIHADEPVRWSAWRRYYRSIGMNFCFREMARPDRREWTVPTEMPSQFDPRWRDEDPTDSRFNQRDYPSLHDRRREADMLMAKLPIGLRPKRKKYGGTTPEEVLALAESEAKSAYSDLQISDELVGILHGRNAA